MWLPPVTLGSEVLVSLLVQHSINTTLSTDKSWPGGTYDMPTASGRLIMLGSHLVQHALHQHNVTRRVIIENVVVT